MFLLLVLIIQEQSAFPYLLYGVPWELGTCGDDLFKFVAILLSYDNMVKNDFTSMVLEGVVPS